MHNCVKIVSQVEAKLKKNTIIYNSIHILINLSFTPLPR